MSLLEINILLSLMILTILFFRKLGGKKVSKDIIMALWNLVLVRALIPYSIPIGQLPIFQEKWQSSSSEIPKIWETAKESQSVSPEAIWQMQKQTGDLQPTEYMPWVWAIGALCLFLYFLFAYMREHKVLKSSEPVQNSTVERMIQKESLHRKIRLYEGGSFETPVTYGILFPKIVLPPDFEAASRLDVRNMIAHELEHIRKFDVGKRYLMILVLCIYWFNPLVWLMYRTYREDQEMACDERVMRKMKKGEAKNYIYTLIKMGTEEKHLFATTTGFGGRNAGKKRILQALNQRRKGIMSIAGSVFFGGCLLLAFVSLSQPESNISAMADNKDTKKFAEAVETGEEQVPELIEPRYVKDSDLLPYDEDFDYFGVMQDIVDNYNDLSQELTEDQVKALRINNSAYLAKKWKEKGERGEKLTSHEIWTIEEYGGVDIGE